MKKKEIKKLDKIVRELCLKRDKKCVKCGIKESLNIHHLVGRTNYALRWELDNLICLCSGCHTLRRNSYHNDPTNWEGFKKRYPKRYKIINNLKNKIIKHDFEKELERLNGNNTSRHHSAGKVHK